MGAGLQILGATGCNRLNKRVLVCMVTLTVTGISGACGGRTIKQTTTLAPNAKPVLKDATREELLDKYNQFATGVKSVNATVVLRPTTGSKYSGVIEEYHEVKAFLLAQRPAEIRVIGQAPVVGTTVFDMASDGETFWVSIPSKNKFLVGAVALERVSSKPIENLRPHHLLDALLWPEIRKEESVLFEEFNDENARFYVLTVLRGGYRTEILRKVWFNRVDLDISRLQTYGPKGVLLSDVHLSDWEALVGDQEHLANTAANMVNAFPRSMRLDRPHDDYELDLTITKLVLNQDIPADRFHLEQPAGSELVRVGDNPEDKPR
jgi:outer membrane lipoprotein-sorting protein